MKKAKKYIYPFIFSICSYLFYIILAITINALYTPDNYGGLAIALVLILLWLLLSVPIYSVIYSKIIKNEKRKFLFAVYNAVVISLSYILPFCLEEETYIYGSIFFAWVLCWNFLPFIWLKEEKEQTDNKSGETEK